MCSQVGISKDAAINLICNYSRPKIAADLRSCNIQDIQLVVVFNQYIALCVHGLSEP